MSSQGALPAHATLLLLSSSLVGARARVYWRDDARWYAGRVVDVRVGAAVRGAPIAAADAMISYDDNTSEWISLTDATSGTGAVSFIVRRLRGAGDAAAPGPVVGSALVFLGSPREAAAQLAGRVAIEEVGESVGSDGACDVELLPFQETSERAVSARATAMLQASDAAALRAQLRALDSEDAASFTVASTWVATGAASMLVRYRGTPARGQNFDAAVPPVVGLDSDALALAMPTAAYSTLRTVLSTLSAFDPELGALVVKDFRDRDRRLIAASAKDAKERHALLGGASAAPAVSTSTTAVDLASAASSSSTSAGDRKRRRSSPNSDGGPRAHSALPCFTDVSTKATLDELVGLWVGWWDWGEPLGGREYACRAGAAVEAVASGTTPGKPSAELPASFFSVAEIGPGGLPPARLSAMAQQWACLEASITGAGGVGGRRDAAVGAVASAGSSSSIVEGSSAGAGSGVSSAPLPSKPRKNAELAALGVVVAPAGKRRAVVDASPPVPTSPSKGVPRKEAPESCALPFSLAPDGWALSKPCAGGRWVVGWVARYDAESKLALVVLDWPSAVGATISTPALSAAGIHDSHLPLLYTQWIDLIKIRALPLLRPTPLAGLRPSCISIALTPPSSIDESPRCSFCLHTARPDAPLLACSISSTGGSLPVCGRFAHAECRAPSERGGGPDVFSCDSCSHYCRMCGTRNARGNVVDFALHNESIERRDAIKRDSDRARRTGTSSVSLAASQPSASSPLPSFYSPTLAQDPTRPGPAGPRRDRLLPFVWESATMDERGCDSEDGVWKAYKYVPIPGDNVFSARLRALRGEPLPACASILAAADRRAAELKALEAPADDADCLMKAEDGDFGVAAGGASASAAELAAAASPSDALQQKISQLVTFFSGEATIPNEVDYDYDGPLRWNLCNLPLPPAAATAVAPDAPVVLDLCSACASRMASGAFCPCCHGGYAEDSGLMLACDNCES